MRRPATLALVPLFFCLSCVSCRKDDEQAAALLPSAGVTRCEHGILKALQSTTYQETQKIYYEECADLFTDAVCRDAWHAAARAEPSAQLGLIADACKKSYCPALGFFSFAICKDGWVATPQSLERDWPPLFNAIVARESGMSAEELETGLLAVYARAAGLKAQSEAASPSAAPPAASGAASAAPPAASGAPAPAASASSTTGVVGPGAATSPSGKPAAVIKVPPTAPTGAPAPHASAR